jgi:hypothetical protein
MSIQIHAIVIHILGVINCTTQTMGAISNGSGGFLLFKRAQLLNLEKGQLVVFRFAVVVAWHPKI